MPRSRGYGLADTCHRVPPRVGSRAALGDAVPLFRAVSERGRCRNLSSNRMSRICPSACDARRPRGPPWPPVLTPLGRAQPVRAGSRRGANDAAALAQADLGLATGAGVVIEASDLTLVRGDILAADDAICLSRRSLRTIKSNLFWAFAYNVAALLLVARRWPVRVGAADRRGQSGGDAWGSARITSWSLVQPRRCGRRSRGAVPRRSVARPR
jgi:hypothetical protein